MRESGPKHWGRTRAALDGFGIGAPDALVGNIRCVGGELEGFWAAYRRVADDVKPRGNLAPDAHLVALMHEHGVSTIWSNDRDLRKFGGITVKDPFDDRYATGFG